MFSLGATISTVFVDLFVSKRRVSGLLEDGWLYCPSPSSVPVQDEAPPPIVVDPVECDIPAPGFASAVHVDASCLIGVVVDSLRDFNS
jgi:hypothetical protein